MKFYTQLKAQHIALLLTQPTNRLNWRLVWIVAAIMIVSGSIIYGLFGDDVLVALSQMVMQETGDPLLFPEHWKPWLLLLMPLADIFSEIVWVTLVAFITMRVLKYLKTPFSFRHIVNMYLLVRCYEMAAGFALLLGFTVVAVSTGTDTLPLLQQESTAAGLLSSLIVPVLFFWMYLSSIRFMIRRQRGIVAETKHKTDV